MIRLQVLKQLPTVTAVAELLLHFLFGHDINNRVRGALKLLQASDNLFAPSHDCLRRRFTRMQLAIDINYKVHHVGALEKLQLSLEQLFLIVYLKKGHH